MKIFLIIGLIISLTLIVGCSTNQRQAFCESEGYCTWNWVEDSDGNSDFFCYNYNRGTGNITTSQIFERDILNKIDCGCCCD